MEEVRWIGEMEGVDEVEEVEGGQGRLLGLLGGLIASSSR